MLLQEGDAGEAIYPGGWGRAPAYCFLMLDGVLEQHAHQQAPLAEAGVPPHLLIKTQLSGCAVCAKPLTAHAGVPDYACLLA